LRGKGGKIVSLSGDGGNQGAGRTIQKKKNKELILIRILERNGGREEREIAGGAGSNGPTGTIKVRRTGLRLEIAGQIHTSGGTRFGKNS